MGYAVARAYGLDRDTITVTSYREHPHAAVMTADTSYDISHLKQLMPFVRLRRLDDELLEDAENRGGRIVKLLETGGRFLVRFDPGETLPEALVELARTQGWRTASLQGLGAVHKVVLAYYDLQVRQYLKFPVEGIVELVSLTGNLSSVDGVPTWHLHAAVADRTGALKGGHLVALEVAITLECWIHPADRTVTRRLDERSGLNLLDL